MDPADFELLQRAAGQFLELPDDRLSDAGLSEARVRDLRELLRRGSGELKSEVLTIKFLDSGGSSIGGGRWHQEGDSLVLWLPVESMDAIRILYEMVLATFGSKELFYRTGYSGEDIRIAVNKLSPVEG